jgi:hypothetical protein
MDYFEPIFDVRGCLKSCSEMTGYGKHLQCTLKIALSSPGNSIFIGHASNPP